MRSRRVDAAILLATLSVCGVSGGTAAASFTICNRSFDVANAAIAREVDGVPQTEGWWRIGPNQCAQVIDTPLTGDTVGVFALDVFGRDLLTGAVQLCVLPSRFEIANARDNCLTRGYLNGGFLQVDTGTATSWRMFLAPAPE